jgi:protein SCO1/2
VGKTIATRSQKPIQQQVDWIIAMQKRNHFISVPVFFVCTLLMSCQHSPEQRYDLKGKVVSVDKAKEQVTLAHEPVEGYMDAMTMPFTVRDRWALDELAPGQEVEATLVVRGDRSWIEGFIISQTVDSDSPVVANSLPEIGKEVPDFSLLNQDNRPIHLGQYRGRPLLLTFIYTRCPLPDYCPLTSRNFSEIHQNLASMPASSRKPRLLTISFDSEHDTPPVLRDYAGRYMKPTDFDEWGFATGSPEEIKEITGYFGLTYYKESNQIIHSLVTALIGPDGKLKRLYPGNEWTPSQILADLK